MGRRRPRSLRAAPHRDPRPDDQLPLLVADLVRGAGLTVIDPGELRPRARGLAAAIEPVAGQVAFSPESHQAYEARGFAPSPSETFNGVHLPDGPAYFTSRGSVMGQVPGEVVAAAFAVFNPEVVVPLVAYGWSLTDA